MSDLRMLSGKIVNYDTDSKCKAETEFIKTQNNIKHIYSKENTFIPKEKIVANIDTKIF